METEQGELRTCKKCNQSRPIDQFGWSKTRNKRHRRNVCRLCIYAQERDRRDQKGSISHKAKQKHWRLNNPVSVCLTGAKTRSKQRNLECTITPEYLRTIWEQQQNHCAVSGLQFRLDKAGDAFRPSLDRIDARKGYVEGNVRFVLSLVNMGMSDFGEADFVRVAHAVSERNDPFSHPNSPNYEFNADVERLTKDLAAVVGN